MKVPDDEQTTFHEASVYVFLDEYFDRLEGTWDYENFEKNHLEEYLFKFM